jgi:hypothetical protein
MKGYGKEIEKTLIGKEKHRVLLFGERTCKDYLDINLDYCVIDVIPFPTGYKNLKTLSDYTLVILDYSAFMQAVAGVYEKEQEIFEKQMHQALDLGTCFCFLHYDDIVPADDQYNYRQGHMDEKDIGKCLRMQIGFRWLKYFDIRPMRFDNPICFGEARRNEFKKYIDRWGASKLAFSSYGKETFSDIIVQLGNKFVLAFTLNQERGKLIYLPCQRDFSRKDVLQECFVTLIDCLITYLSKSRMELPEWAAIPIFGEEEKLFQEKSNLKDKLTECEGKLDMFYSAKQLLFQSEYGLEDAVPKFLNEQCGINIKREETYREDFWILNQESELSAICEVKSYVKGFKKGGLFNLYNHRESYNLEESFPAVLFVNANLNAASWEQKDRPIDKQDYEEAANKHLLILRIEDLLFAWQAIREGALTPDKLTKIFNREVGWLKFKKDKTWEILK